MNSEKFSARFQQRCYAHIPLTCLNKQSSFAPELYGCLLTTRLCMGSGDEGTHMDHPAEDFTP